MIEMLEANNGLMAAFFDDLSRLKEKAKETAKALTESSPTVDLNQEVLVGKQAYIIQIKVVLLCITQRLAFCNSRFLTPVAGPARLLGIYPFALFADPPSSPN